MYLVEEESTFSKMGTTATKVTVIHYSLHHSLHHSLSFDLKKKIKSNYSSAKTNVKNREWNQLCTLEVSLSTVIVIYIIVACKLLKIILWWRLPELPLVALHLNQIQHSHDFQKCWTKLRSKIKQSKYWLNTLDLFVFHPNLIFVLYYLRCIPPSLSVEYIYSYWFDICNYDYLFFSNFWDNSFHYFIKILLFLLKKSPPPPPLLLLKLSEKVTYYC